MKIIGGVLMVIGIALLILVAYSFFKQGESTHSPVPEDRGVKVIFVSPTP